MLDRLFQSTRPAGFLILLLSVAAAWGMWKLDYQDNPRDLYLRAGPESDLLQHMYESFGSDDNTVLILARSEQPIFSLGPMGELKRIVDGLEALDGVADVNSLFDLRRQRVPIRILDMDVATPERLAEAEQLAMRHPLARGLMLSESGHATIVTVRLAGQSLSIADLQKSLAKIERVIEPPYIDAADSPLEIDLAGSPVVRVESLSRLRVDQIKFCTFGGLAAMVIAIYLFRQWQAVTLALLGPLLGVFWTLGAMGWLGHRIDGIKVIIPTLLFIIGFTDSLHLVMGLGRLQRAAGGHLSPLEAARRTIKELGGACLMTSLTTAVGFGSLMLSGTTSIQRFGFCCALGAILLFAAVILVFFGMAARPFGSQVARSRPFHRNVPQRSRLISWTVRAMHYPRTIVATAFVLSAIMLMFCLRLEPNIFWTESIARSSPTIRAIERMDQAFGGTSYGAVLVRWPAGDSVASPDVVRAMAATHQVLRAEPTFGEPVSIANVLASLDYVGGGFSRRWRYVSERDGDASATTRLVNEANREAIVYFLTADVGAFQTEKAIRNVDQQLRKLEAETGVQLTLGGTPVVAGRVFTNMISELATSLAVATGLVFAIIAIPLRSLTLALACILPNTFPLLVAGTAIYATTGYLTLTNTLTFCLCLGIAVDDTIHFLIHYRDSTSSGASVPKAVVTSLHRVGRVLIVSSVILVAGLAGMLTSEVPPLRIFSGLAILAIASALIGDLLVLPAILLLVDKRTKNNGAIGPTN